MTSRTMSATMVIIFYFFLVCNANIMSTQMPTIQNHSETLLNTDNSLVSTSTHSDLSTALDVTNTSFSNTITTMFNASELSPFSTSTAATSTQSTVNISGSTTLNVTVALASHPSSSVSSTGPFTSSNNQTDRTTMSVGTSAKSTTLSTKMNRTPQNNGTETTPNGTTTTNLSDTDKYNMRYSEIILTSIFSAVLVVVVLVILSFGFKRCLSRSQYSHHPLRETSYDSADRYSTPDDTLVISGGLYDAPRIYNPNMTVLEEEEPQNDYASFNTRTGQFRLEFLPGDKDMDPVLNGQRRNV